jgi:hypothetical protein
MPPGSSSAWTTSLRSTATPQSPSTPDDHQAFDGIVFPTRRRIYRRNADRTADKSEATITLDLDSITLA